MNILHGIPFGYLDNTNLILFFVGSDTLSESYFPHFADLSIMELKINKQYSYTNLNVI